MVRHFENVFWTKDLTDSKRSECSKKAQDALNKFNRNLFLKFEDIFEKENHLNEIVIFFMDIKQLDQLKSEESKREFLEYDLERYNSKHPDWCIESTRGGEKRKYLTTLLIKLN